MHVNGQMIVANLTVISHLSDFELKSESLDFAREANFEQVVLACSTRTGQPSHLRFLMYVLLRVFGQGS